MSFFHCPCCPSSRDAVTGSKDVVEADVSALLEMLSSVPDPRKRRGKQYPLVFILAASVVASLGGAKNYKEISDVTADMPQSLLQRLGAKWNWFESCYQCPSEKAMREVLKNVDAAVLDDITCSWIFSQAVKYGGKGDVVIAIDGKVLRGAWTDENDKVTLFSAMLHEEAVTVAQVRVPDGTNEITQAQAIMDAMEIPEGKTVLFTMDAAHTQDGTAKIFGGDSRTDYAVTVKGNQPTLQREVFKKVLPLLRSAPHDVMEEHGRGVIKKWSCWVGDAGGIDFPHASQCAFIRREIFDVTDVRISKEHALIITSRNAEKIGAADLNRHVRGQWTIENKSHYIRDTAYQEDRNQAWQGEGPQVLAALRNLAISLLRMNGAKNIKETMQWVQRDRNRALQFMTT